jgi:hypothetical protein
MGAVANLLLLQIDLKRLHLAEQKTGERRARVRHVGQVAAERAEDKQSLRRGRLNYIQPLPAKIGARLDAMTAPREGERVGNLTDARTEVGRGVGW